jgi:hypothetical protein
MMALAMRTSNFSPRARTARPSFASVSPGTYSMTSMSCSASRTMSSVGTTLGCLMRAASRASSRNIATVRAKPPVLTSLPMWTDAIPPDAISANKL